MPKLTIDGVQIEVEPGITVLQACERAGVEIPRFCYHERLSIAGNCRMCLVEQEKAPKPIASCAMPVMDGMVIKTNTPMVKKARHGRDGVPAAEPSARLPDLRSGRRVRPAGPGDGLWFRPRRYDENKRAVKDKYMGPLIKTIMTRCIHCNALHPLRDRGRGRRGGWARSAAASTWRSQPIWRRRWPRRSRANVIDLCPVGALTSKPYAFEARPWELRHTESVDVMDALGAPSASTARGREVMRVLPRLNEDVNEEWISDKSRYRL
jgi:NADH-quinone oxidoreductase subunit G